MGTVRYVAVATAGISLTLATCWLIQPKGVAGYALTLWPVVAVRLHDIWKRRRA